MKNSQRSVVDFHKALGAEIAPRPTLLPCNVAVAEPIARELGALANRCSEIGLDRGLLFSRLAMSLEELAEWVEAHAAGDLVAAADAWGDRQYVLLGDAVAAGLPAQQIFEEVHQSNMTKVARPRDSTGKARKDERFEPPSLARILGL